MNKSELVAAMADKAGVTAKEAGDCLDAFFDVVADVVGNVAQAAGLRGATRGIGLGVKEKQDLAPLVGRKLDARARLIFECEGWRLVASLQHRTLGHLSQPLAVCRSFEL